MNEMVLDFEVSDTVLTRMEVYKITDVPDLFVGTTVGVTVGVKVWTGSLAAFSQVACQIVRFYGETLPNWWMWNPWWPGARPFTTAVIFVL